MNQINVAWEALYLEGPSSQSVQDILNLWIQDQAHTEHNLQWIQYHKLTIQSVQAI